jgi:hypothetical protein
LSAFLRGRRGLDMLLSPHYLRRIRSPPTSTFELYSSF